MVYKYVCEFCHKPKELKNIPKRPRRFCSLYCQTHQVIMGNYTCGICNKSFVRHRSQVTGDAVFCGPVCKNIYNSEAQKVFRAENKKHHEANKKKLC